MPQDGGRLDVHVPPAPVTTHNQMARALSHAQGYADFQRWTSAVPSTAHARMARALSIPGAEGHARKQSITGSFVAVAKGIVVATVVATVAAGVLSTVSAFFSRRSANRGGRRAKRTQWASEAPAATWSEMAHNEQVFEPAGQTEPAGSVVPKIQIPKGAETTLEDGEWVFMPRSMQPLLEHFDFELSANDVRDINDAEPQAAGAAGSARLRLSRCVL